MTRHVRLGRRTGEFIDTHYHGLMPFHEIGKALGITRGGAWMLYRNGIRKLKRYHPQALQRLRDLSEFKNRLEK